MRELEFTGERVVPGAMQGLTNVFVQHLSRYVFAIGKMNGVGRIVDAASGTGYGTLLLAMTGTTTTGIEISPESVEFASERFKWPGLDYVQGDLETAPLPQDVDVFVSFETIEHLQDPEGFLERLSASLKPDGMAILSIPRNMPSEWHRHVYDWTDAMRLVEPHFGDVVWYSQREEDVHEGVMRDAYFCVAVCRSPRKAEPRAASRSGLWRRVARWARGG
jgi:2-polyprenyl-3-methyl-5-hydroxy-6-metoxy-1,4-benzoquinol methylase